MNQMKSFLRHLKANPLYAGDFEDRQDVFRQFCKSDDPTIIILYASYENECYDGSAIVLYYRKDTRRYYEAYASHCSCYGLEYQWDKDEILLAEELDRRLSDGHLRDSNVLKEAYNKFKEGK